MKTILSFYNLSGLAITLIFFFASVSAQTTSDFESFGLNADEFNNNAMSAGFNDGNLFLPNDYSEEFLSWNGWAISATTDTQTAGFSNQYSAVTGGGVNGSTSYAVSFQFGSNYILPQGDAANGYMEGLYVNNNTYAYFSMLEGDNFAKRFGGETGDDPDFFLLTINAYLNDVENDDSITFYLADYRFEDNALDYILTDWTYIDLQPLGNLDSLTFTLTSSDNGQFGMNTPAFFCVDNITTADMPVATKDIAVEALRIFPNPAQEQLQVTWPYDEPAIGRLYGMQGPLVAEWHLQPGNNTLNVAQLPAAIYSLVCEGREQITVNRIVKK